MSFRLTEPGIFSDILAADYFADCAPAPSLTQSLAKILLEKSPLHCWHAHPRMNPDYRHNDDTKFDVGNIAHKLMIGRGKEIAVLEGFDDWRTKAAKEAREEAAACGKVAVLGKHFSLADRMVRAAREQLAFRGLDHLFGDHGSGEVVTAWREGDVWMRQMIDWLSADRLLFVDFKTTDLSAAPHGLSRMMANAGWPIQAAMGERGLDALDPQNAGRRRYLFIVQETDVPYALSVVEIGEAALTMGRKSLDMAAAIWQQCMDQNIWPGYPTEIQSPEYPAFMETRLLEREVEFHDRRTREPMLTSIAGG